MRYMLQNVKIGVSEQEIKFSPLRLICEAKSAPNPDIHYSAPCLIWTETMLHKNAFQ